MPWASASGWIYSSKSPSWEAAWPQMRGVFQWPAVVFIPAVALTGTSAS